MVCEKFFLRHINSANTFFPKNYENVTLIVQPENKNLKDHCNSNQLEHVILTPTYHKAKTPSTVDLIKKIMKYILWNLITVKLFYEITIKRYIGYSWFIKRIRTWAQTRMFRKSGSYTKLTAWVKNSFITSSRVLISNMTIDFWNASPKIPK